MRKALDMARSDVRSNAWMAFWPSVLLVGIQCIALYETRYIRLYWYIYLIVPNSTCD